MGNLKYGDIVLLKFPYTDETSFKRRPALVLSDTDDGDIIVCRITSQIYKTPFDVQIYNWEESGLKLPSVIRIHKLATLDKSLVEKSMGNIDHSQKQKVNDILSKLTE